MEFREIKNKEYLVTEVRTLLTKKGYNMVSNTPITSAIIKAYEFWYSNTSDRCICLEIWKNDTTTIFNQIKINEI